MNILQRKNIGFYNKLASRLLPKFAATAAVDSLVIILHIVEKLAS